MRALLTQASKSRVSLRAAWLLVGMVAMLAVAALLLLPKAREARLSEMETRDGLIYVRGESAPFRGGVLDFYPSGKQLSLTPVNNGKVEGWSVGWFESGRMEVRESFKDGVSDGTRTRWYPNGQVRSVAYIRHGNIEGLFREWHENGKLQREVVMKNGKPNGRADSWTSAGKPSESFTYAGGVLLAQKPNTTQTP